MANWGFVLWLIGLSAIVFFAVMWLMDISTRQRQLQGQLGEGFGGTEGQDLSGPLAAMTERLDENAEQTQLLRSDLDRLAGQLPQGAQAVGLVRFQAFSDYGGDQSFALALTNAAGDGAVVSGIYGREGTRVYAKPLAAWTSSYSLSLEEEEAIDQAKNQLE